MAGAGVISSEKSKDVSNETHLVALLEQALTIAQARLSEAGKISPVVIDDLEKYQDACAGIRSALSALRGFDVSIAASSPLSPESARRITAATSSPPSSSSIGTVSAKSRLAENYLTAIQMQNSLGVPPPAGPASSFFPPLDEVSEGGKDFTESPATDVPESIDSISALHGVSSSARPALRRQISRNTRNVHAFLNAAAQKNVAGTTAAACIGKKN